MGHSYPIFKIHGLLIPPKKVPPSSKNAPSKFVSVRILPVTQCTRALSIVWQRYNKSTRLANNLLFEAFFRGGSMWSDIEYFIIPLLVTPHSEIPPMKKEVSTGGGWFLGAPLILVGVGGPLFNRVNIGANICLFQWYKFISIKNSHLRIHYTTMYTHIVNNIVCLHSFHNLSHLKFECAIELISRSTFALIRPNRFTRRDHIIF